MATFTSNKAKSGVQARFLEEGVTSVAAVYTASATLSATDVIQMIKVPSGARVLDIKVKSNALAGSGALVNVGDSIDTDRYFDGTGGGTMVATTIRNAAGISYEYTAADTVDIVVSAVGSAPTSAAVFDMTLMYECNQD